MSDSRTWMALVSSLPAHSTGPRMRLWRAVRALGAASLRDGVYLLPAIEHHEAGLRELADEVRQAGGAAEVLRLEAYPEQSMTFVAMFDRGAEYAALIAEIEKIDPVALDGQRRGRRLERRLSELEAIDFFPGAARTQARQALKAMAARLVPDEPGSGAGSIRILRVAEYRGRRWATRRRPRVDRLACAWLIRRYIDPEARFVWLTTPAECPSDALGFDFDGARFSHLAGPPERVSFEVMAASFAIDADPAIRRIGAIVHCLDVGGVPIAEAAGIGAVLDGLAAVEVDDDRLAAAACVVFDGLRQAFAKEPADGR